MSKISASAKLVLHVIVNLAGNSLIIATLPTFLPASVVAIVFLAFNIVQVIYAYVDPTFTVHLIQTGQLSVPPKADNTQ